MTEHTFYMQRAIALAKRGCGKTNPNPMVGAVIVKGHRIIGEGWHVQYGALHAERHALANCTESPEDATLYGHVRAMLPLRQAATLHRSSHTERD